jgi:hypothetical protein
MRGKEIVDPAARVRALRVKEKRSGGSGWGGSARWCMASTSAGGAQRRCAAAVPDAGPPMWSACCYGRCRTCAPC